MRLYDLDAPALMSYAGRSIQPSETSLHPLVHPSLEAASPHIWYLPLTAKRIAAYQETKWLAPFEQERLALIQSSEGQARYLALHSMLRQILASYLALDIADLKIERTRYERPILAPGQYELPLDFNLSHSGDLGVLAITRSGQVGVDIEHLQIQRNIPAIARRYFSESVCLALQTLPEAERPSRFLRIWTQYEAYKKAQGVGLRGGDPKLEFDFEPWTPLEVTPLFAKARPANWCRMALSPNDEYIGSLVCTRADMQQAICLEIPE